mgnify:CR=1 FL=1
MFDMIDDYKPTSPKFIVPQMGMVQERSQQLIKRLRRYWLGSGSFCQGDHPLVNALYSIDAISDELVDIYYIAKEQAGGVARAYGWVSDTGFGKIKKRSRTFPKVMVDHKMGASLAEGLGSPTA